MNLENILQYVNKKYKKDYDKCKIIHRNRERAKEYYDNKIKTNPEKYKQFLEKCKKPSNDYYHKNKNLSVEI